MDPPPVKSDPSPAQEDPPAAKRTPPNLMTIPLELREYIYTFTFSDTTPDEYSDPAKPSERQIDLLKAKSHYPDPALLTTSRQISLEALPLFQKAANKFWEIEFFALELPGLRGTPSHFGFSIIDGTSSNDAIYDNMRVELDKMSLLRTRRVKGMRFLWPEYSVTYEHAQGGTRTWMAPKRLKRDFLLEGDAFCVTVVVDEMNKVRATHDCKEGRLGAKAQRLCCEMAKDWRRGGAGGKLDGSRMLGCLFAYLEIEARGDSTSRFSSIL